MIGKQKQKPNQPTALTKCETDGAGTKAETESFIRADDQQQPWFGNRNCIDRNQKRKNCRSEQAQDRRRTVNSAVHHRNENVACSHCRKNSKDQSTTPTGRKKPFRTSAPWWKLWKPHHLLTSSVPHGQVKRSIEPRSKVERCDVNPFLTLLEYYTPKTIIFQALLDIFTIFVNYADFYVNTVM